MLFWVNSSSYYYLGVRASVLLVLRKNSVDIFVSLMYNIIMKIKTYSDLHLEFGYPGFSASGDVCILAGDISTNPSSIEKFVAECLDFNRVFFVIGNHEYYGKYSRSDYLNLKGIETLDCSVSSYQTQRFVGCTLWGGHITPKVISGINDFSPERCGEDALLGYEHSLWLSETIKPGDVVITHHCPRVELNNPLFLYSSVNGGFINNFPSPMGAKLWVSGHTHYNFDRELNGCRYVANQYGYWNHEQSSGLPFEINKECII